MLPDIPYMQMTRGERNNNPGNIRHTPQSNWWGQRPTRTDPVFCEFLTARDGIRALAKILYNYKRFHGADSIRDVIEIWAPPNKNDTSAYIKSVSASMGLGIDAPLDLWHGPTLCKLVAAIIKQENGRCIYPDDLIAEAVNRALDPLWPRISGAMKFSNA